MVHALLDALDFRTGEGVHTSPFGHILAEKQLNHGDTAGTAKTLGFFGFCASPIG